MLIWANKRMKYMGGYAAHDYMNIVDGFSRKATVEGLGRCEKMASFANAPGVHSGKCGNTSTRFRKLKKNCTASAVGVRNSSERSARRRPNN